MQIPAGGALGATLVGEMLSGIDPVGSFPQGTQDERVRRAVWSQWVGIGFPETRRLPFVRRNQVLGVMLLNETIRQPSPIRFAFSRSMKRSLRACRSRIDWIRFAKATSVPASCASARRSTSKAIARS